MSLEYAIEFPCVMRQRFGESRLRELARTGALVSRVVTASLATESAPSPESVAFTTQYADDLEHVETIAQHCRAHCPAHLEAHFDLPDTHEAIGCMGRVHYPIDARFERFLADRVQLLYDTSGEGELPRLLQMLLGVDSPFDGEATKALRCVTTSQGLRFFELRLPIQLAGSAARLNTDNIFDVLAGFSASDDGQSGYQRALPTFALPDYATLVTALFWHEVSESEHARLQLQSQTFNAYVRWARAVQLAESLSVKMLLD